jgi:hypothetical protein
LRLICERRSQSILQDTQSPQPRNIVILGTYALAQAVYYFHGSFRLESQP